MHGHGDGITAVLEVDDVSAARAVHRDGGCHVLANVGDSAALELVDRPGSGGRQGSDRAERKGSGQEQGKCFFHEDTSLII